jgi:hypothetical protein
MWKKGVAVAMVAFTQGLAAQEWAYQVYVGEGFPSDQVITFQLKAASPGQHTARFVVGGTLDDCIRREHKATVSMQGEEQVVVMEAPMRGCPDRRLVLKTDGSGGRMEMKQTDGSWVWDGRERGMKRKP